MLLLLSLRLATNGKNVLPGASHLRDKLEERVADSRLTIVDVPLVNLGAGTSPFDITEVSHFDMLYFLQIFWFYSKESN